MMMEGVGVGEQEGACHQIPKQTYIRTNKLIVHMVCLQLWVWFHSSGAGVLQYRLQFSREGLMRTSGVPMDYTQDDSSSIN